MKKLLVIGLVLISFGFSQYKYVTGAFWKDFSVATTATAASNYVQIGLLPPNAFISSIRVFSLTNSSVITNSLLSVGIVSSTNYFVNALQIGTASQVEFTTGALSNGGLVLSTTAPTPIYGRYVYNGVAGTTNFTFKVLVNYIQR